MHTANIKTRNTCTILIKFKKSVLKCFIRENYYLLENSCKIPALEIYVDLVILQIWKTLNVDKVLKEINLMYFLNSSCLVENVLSTKVQNK